MTMLVCPECKRIVDDSVKNCPGCKYNIRKYVKAAKQGASTAFLGAITLSSVYDSKEKLPINTPKLEFLSSAPAGDVVFDSPSLNGLPPISNGTPEATPIFDSPSLNAKVNATVATSPSTTQTVEVESAVTTPTATAPTIVANPMNTAPIFESPSLTGLPPVGAATMPTPPITTSIFDSPILNKKIATNMAPVAGASTNAAPIFESPSLNGLSPLGTTSDATVPMTKSIFDSPILNQKTMTTPANPTTVAATPVNSTMKSAAPIFESPSLNGLPPVGASTQTTTSIFDSPVLNANTNSAPKTTSIFDSPILNNKMTNQVEQKNPTQGFIFDSPVLNGLVQANSLEQSAPTNVITEAAQEAQETPMVQQPTAPTSTYSYNPLLGGTAPVAETPIFDSPSLNGFAVETTNDNGVNSSNPLLGGSYTTPQPQAQETAYQTPFSPLGGKALENPLLNSGNPLLGAHNPLLGQTR